MRAVQVTRPDGPEALEVGEVPDPVHGEGEVLVEVRAAGVNFPDLLLTRDRYQYRPERPFVLGGEFAGVVLEAPPGSEFSPGDRVAGSSTLGAFAERVAAPAWNVFPLPDRTGFAAGGCVPVNYLTMLFGLVTRGQLREGETVLVHGAAGGIGTATVQLARALGCRVLSVVSTPEKAEFVTGVGSHETVLADGFKDAVLQLTGGEGVGWGAYAQPRRGYARQEWERLLPHVESGVVDPPISGSYPLERAGEAVSRLADRSVLGKVVVEP